MSPGRTKACFFSESARTSRRERRAFAAALSRLEAALADACSSQAPWPASVIDAVRAGFRFAATEPQAAGLLLIDAAADPDHADARSRMVDSLAARLRAAAGEHALLAAGREEVLISAVLGMVAIRLTMDQARTLPTATLEAAEFLLSPYLGDERVRRLIAGAIDASLSSGG